MALPATDDFTGTDSSYLKDRTGWSDTYASSMYIKATNRVTSELPGNYATGASNMGGASWTSDSFAQDQYSEIIIVTALAYAGGGVIVRRQAGADSYYGLLFNTDTCWLFKRTAGSNATLDTHDVTRTAGSKLRLTATGGATTVLTAYYNDVEILAATDTSTPFTTGSAGVCGIGDSSGQRMDDWEGGNIGAAAGHPTMSRWQGIPGMKYTGRKGW